MTKLFAWAIGLALLVPVLAFAQTPQVIKLEVPCNNGSPSTSRCFVDASPTVPVAGYQQISSTTLGSATKLTVPAGASAALVIATGTNGTSGACVDWADDGTVPTSTVGMPLPAVTPLYYQASALAGNLQFIQAASATCTLNVTYYKQ